MKEQVEKLDKHEFRHKKVIEDTAKFQQIVDTELEQGMKFYPCPSCGEINQKEECLQYTPEIVKYNDPDELRMMDKAPHTKYYIKEKTDQCPHNRGLERLKVLVISETIEYYCSEECRVAGRL